MSVRNANQHAVVGVFENRVDAERAVDELRGLGFGDEQLGFAMRELGGGTAPSRDESSQALAEEEHETGREAAKGVVTGGVVGGVLGALATGLIPGIGPVLAAGLLAGILGGAAVGAAAGGLIGSLVSLGIPEEEARYYQREFENGRAVVTVNAGPRADAASEVLRRRGAHDVHDAAS
jgi:hypothetical protein